MSLIDRIRRSSLAVMIRCHIPTKESKETGKRIKKLAKEKGLSTEYIANYLNQFDKEYRGFSGWTKKHIRRIYRGTLVLFPFETFKSLTDLLGTTVSEVLGKKGDW